MRHINFSLIHFFIGLYSILSINNALLPSNNIGIKKAENENIWNLVTQKKDIKVYTRKSKGTKLKEVRVKASFETTIENFLMVLNDVDNYEDWVYKCKSSYKLHSISDREYIYYTESNMPSIISNRDLLVHSKQWVDELTGTVYSVSIAKPDFKPTKRGIIRIEDFKSQWIITSPKQNKILVDYTVKVDPGGSMPTWVVNLGISKGPLETMKKLKKIVEQ